MMRAMLVAFTVTGAISMSDIQAANEGQEKKEEKKEPKDPYKEFVTVRRWTNNDKKFENAHKDVMAFRRDIKGSLVIALRAADTAGGVPEAKTEIIDAEGNVYIITKVSGNVPRYDCYVTKKASDK